MFHFSSIFLSIHIHIPAKISIFCVIVEKSPQRRVDPFIFVEDLDGKSSQTLSWLAAHQDPKVIVHPVAPGL
jgi:hypothetical protein